jgi:hypothetical protein
VNVTLLSCGWEGDTGTMIIADQMFNYIFSLPRIFVSNCAERGERRMRPPRKMKRRFKDKRLQSSVLYNTRQPGYGKPKREEKCHLLQHVPFAAQQSRFQTTTSSVDCVTSDFWVYVYSYLSV